MASWYLNTLDPYSPHVRNIEGRLRHPVHVVTRRILYGNVHAATVTEEVGASNTDGSNNNTNDNLESLFNDDDAEIKEGPESLSRRSAARMEAFLASCASALREDEGSHSHSSDPNKGGASSSSSGAKIGGGIGIGGGGSSSGASGSSHRGGTGEKENNNSSSLLDGGGKSSARARSNSTNKPKRCRQIDMVDLLLRLEIYCRT